MNMTETREVLHRCASCKEEIPEGSKFCPECGGQVGSSGQTPTADQTAGTGYQIECDDFVYPRNPPLSPHLAWLALIVLGFPQVIFGQVGKGIVILIVSIISIFFITSIIPVTITLQLALFMPILWTVAIIDAYKVGYVLKAGFPVGKWAFFPTPDLKAQQVMKLKEVSAPENPVNAELWNPRAAADWSILLTPVFGAWLQARNWKNLNEPGKATKSMNWVNVGIVILIIAMLAKVFAHSGYFRLASLFYFLIFLPLWYLISAKKQIKYIRVRKIEYAKKSWIKPLLISFGIMAVCIGGCYFAEARRIASKKAQKVSSRTEIMAKQMKQLVNKEGLSEIRLKRSSYNENLECVEVRIGEEFARNNYYATAIFNDGSKVRYTIQIKDKQMLVQLEKIIKE